MAGKRVTVAGHRDFTVSRPAVPVHAIDRPGVSERLTESVDRFPVTVLLAPAGFGKTAALSAWASQSGRHVSWLSLTPEDGHAEHLRRRLRSVMDAISDPHLQRSGPAEPNGTPITETPVLIIDDIQLADGTGSRKILGALLDRPDPSVRILLAGRFEPKLGLSRLRVSGDLGEISAEELPFTVEEVQQAALVLGRALDLPSARQLIDHTGGWPVAVRLALMSDVADRLGSAGPGPGDHLPQFVDYLVENLLDQLPATLAAFLPRACVCDRITGPLADQLSGGTQGAQLLEEAVDRGIPLERRTLAGGDTVYIWHPVMAQAGRALLMRRDPALIRELHLTAARHLAAAEPYEAAQHAFQARDNNFAAEIIRAQWLALVLRGDSETVEELCGRLASPWSEDPEILTVLAACRRNAGAAGVAAQLGRRAVAGAQNLDPARRRSFDVTYQLAQLFLADEEAALISACDATRGLLDRPAGLEGSARAAAILLLGWSKMRLRQSQEAVDLLSEAVLRCRAEGLDELADRAQASLTFSHAFDGDFTAALAGIGAARSGAGDRTWRRADGAVEAFTEGWVNFWSGNSDLAVTGLREAVAYGGALTSFEPLARVWQVHAALARGIPSEIAQAEEVLGSVPEETIQGLPWRTYKLIAKAGLSVYRGELDTAVGLLDDAVAIDAFIPAVRVLAAELYWLCGLPAQTLAQAQQALKAPGYLRASGLVLSALCARADLDDAMAGSLVEEALKLGLTLRITRPFKLKDQAMAALLTEHATRGTRFEDFLAEQVAWHVSNGSGDGHQLLSGREHEILGYLATRMSADEICRALFISRNTLKTHLKSIYRKLGVNNRRDAGRLAQTTR
ncbi:MAG: hypothetical protein IT193_15590 [Propionibacteriaceae bacterium]|nr:hypothetical protein [Propionibacteriaceae bacterium]